MKKPTIHVNYAILCDDVREEEGGKHILIGVYNDAMVVPEGRDNFLGPIAFFISLSIPSGKEVPVTTWIEGPEGQRMNETEFGPVSRQVPNTGSGLLIWKLLPWRAEGLGHYKIHMTQGEFDAVITEFDIKAQN